VYTAHGGWIGITSNWRHNCSENHTHDWADSDSRGSDSPPYSSSAFDTSPCPSPSASPTPSPDHPPLSKAIPFFDPPSTPRKQPLRSTQTSPTKTTPVETRCTPLTPTKGASSHPSSSRLSKVSSASRAPRPLSASFPRPVYKQEPTLLPVPARLLPELGRWPPDPPRVRRASRPGYEGPEASTAAGDAGALPGIYAVSGCNRVFRNE